ncbi:unnamed protein product, partial [Hapterophycus canaliculatus]
EWHTEDPSSASTAAAPAAAAPGGLDPYGDETDPSTRADWPNNSGGSDRNLFRMTDTLADRTFSFAPAGTPPMSPGASPAGWSGSGAGGAGFDRRLRSASDSGGQHLSARERRGSGLKAGGKDGIGGVYAAAVPAGELPSPPELKNASSLSGSQPPKFSRRASLSSSVFKESPIPGMLRRRLAGQVSHGLSQAEFAVRRDGKLLLATVGLPARGKTYIAQSIKRHMDWFGLRTEIFNAGNYRRKIPEGRNASADLFDPMNAKGAKLRQKCAELALNDALDSLASEEQGVYIAVLDATNTTRERRAWIRDKVEAHEGHVKV